MSLLANTRVALFRASPVRMAGGGKLGPRWNIPEADYHKYTFQPTIPDKHYNSAHVHYSPFTMWYRAQRPYLERIGGSVYKTVAGLYEVSLGWVVTDWAERFPGFGLKCMAFLGVLLGYNFALSYHMEATESYFNLEKLKLYATGQGLWDAGFFKSESEDNEDRIQNFNSKVRALEAEWEGALATATQTRDFSKLTDSLDPSKIKAETPPEPISWRFAMMPYGRDNPDTKTFPDNGIDSPAASNVFALDYMGNAGDYIERTDNKGEPIRKARHFYTAAYIPPTK